MAMPASSWAIRWVGQWPIAAWWPTGYKQIPCIRWLSTGLKIFVDRLRSTPHGSSYNERPPLGHCSDARGWLRWRESGSQSHRCTRFGGGATGNGLVEDGGHPLGQGSVGGSPCQVERCGEDDRTRTAGVWTR